MGDWIGATAHSLVSFRPDVRPVPLELRLNGFDVNHFGSRMLAMAKPAYNFVATGCAGDGSLPVNLPALLVRVDWLLGTSAEEAVFRPLPPPPPPYHHHHLCGE